MLIVGCHVFTLNDEVISWLIVLFGLRAKVMEHVWESDFFIICLCFAGFCWEVLVCGFRSEGNVGNCRLCLSLSYAYTDCRALLPQSIDSDYFLVVAKVRSMIIRGEAVSI